MCGSCMTIGCPQIPGDLCPANTGCAASPALHPEDKFMSFATLERQIFKPDGAAIGHGGTIGAGKQEDAMRSSIGPPTTL